MNNLKTILKKELRAYFLSPVALIFLGVFLVAVLFSFFTSARFFARNIADIRPLFEWLPILLIFLVSAITMRAWSEEQKLGTLEILLTLPMKTRDLVFAKLVAGICLVLLALALTLPIPITVAYLGDLDWGPVVGGYLGALLLASAYLSIGMCVSSLTDNQIVSLMITAVICALFLLIGSDTVVSFFGTQAGELLRSIGTGSRFRSIERGVLDFRDLFYYLSLCAFFLVLNIHFIETKRRDTHTRTGIKRARVQLLTVVLVGLNLIAGNLWLAPIMSARADMTEDGLYSVSSSTDKILAALNEPLYISGYFSEKTHPLLAPLVPRIRDLVTEYEIRGRGKVRLDFTDPNKDEELREEIGELYDIKSLPFRISDRHEESVVNSFFHLLIRYGNQYEVLSFDQLIEVDADQNGVDVRLRNLEYDLTRAIKKVSQGFQTIDTMFGSLSKPATLTAYITPNSLPNEFKDVPERLRKAVQELVDKSDGKFSFKELNPEGNKEMQNEIYQKYGFRPLALDLFGEKSYYLYLLLQVGDQMERIFLQGDLTEAAIKQAIEAGIKRGTPGFLKTIGLLTENPPPVQQNPQLPPQFQEPQRQADYQLLQRSLSEDFTFKRVQVTDGYVPSDIDVLIVARPGSLNDKQKFAIDQYLMRGGALVVLSGAYDIEIDRSGIRAVKSGSGLNEMLKYYGATIEESFLLDKQNARFPVPVQERKGMFMLRRIKMMDYPFFPDIRSDGFSKGHIAVSGLQNVVMNWASPLQIAENLKDIDAEVLLRTSDHSWLYTETEILPESLEAADTAFQPEGKQKSYAVAATFTGRIPSFFSDKPSPLFGADAAEEQSDAEQSKAEKDRTGRTLKESTPEARLVVVSSSAFASDLVSNFSNQIGGGLYRGNAQFLRNLVDWSLADTDLLKIRTSGSLARTLKPMEENERSAWEIGNYVFALAALLMVVVVASSRRRRARPIISLEAKS
ncbi:MAG: Gldg family protein [Deltaproteobacteria bacterium]|nr:Gldg family protein [Deltaproteobacteria bacterium]